MVSTLGWGGKTGGQLKRRTASVLPPAALASRAKAQPAASVAARMMATRTGGDGRPRKPQASGGEGAKRLGQHSGPYCASRAQVPSSPRQNPQGSEMFRNKMFLQSHLPNQKKKANEKKGESD
jgi:hypothetical protein